MQLIPGKMVLALGLASALSCGEPTQPSDTQPPITRLEITPPGTLQINETFLLEIVATDTRGQVVPLWVRPVFTSTDTTVLQVSPTGVAKGLRRGSARIDARLESISTSIDVRVEPRLKIVPSPEVGLPDLPVALGDTVQFAAAFVDVNGNKILDTRELVWASANQAGVSVSATGLAVALVETAVATITVTAGDVSANIRVRVIPASSGVAFVRLAHAAAGVGPITFHLSQGSPVTLSFGQSMERTTRATTFLVEGLEATRQPFAQFLRDGDRLTVFAIGGPNNVGLTPVWKDSTVAPINSGRFRLVQALVDAPLVYLREPGAPVGFTGRPELCYFDPGAVSEYFTRPPGAFDVIFLPKGGGSELNRLRMNAEAGKSMTIVITGSTPAALGYLSFPDY